MEVSRGCFCTMLSNSDEGCKICTGTECMDRCFRILGLFFSLVMSAELPDLEQHI